MIEITGLYIKKKGSSPMVPVSTMNVDKNGIIGGVPCPPIRQVLFLPELTINKFGLNKGQLRENIITKGVDLHNLASGSVVKIGDVRIRLTYHCEPCKVIKEFVNLKMITHQRGYLGTVINEGVLRIGDKVNILGKQFERIPYDIKERIKWFLDKQNEPTTIKKLAFEIGLSPSYYRAIPNMLKKMDNKYKDLVDYPSKKKSTQTNIIR